MYRIFNTLETQVPLNPQVEELYNKVTQLCEVNNIRFRLNKKIFRDKTFGSTELLGNYLCIDLDPDLEYSSNNKKALAVFTHELGEALYRLNNIPFTMIGDCSGNECLFKTLLKETFVHNYINYLVNKHNLENIIAPINRENNTLKNKYNSEAPKYFKIISACWEIITRPYNNCNKENVTYYTEVKSEIDKILNILDKIDYEKNNHDAIKASIESIINILNDNGLKYEIVIDYPLTYES
ncbi:hypothetical protein [Paraclostridium sordellii]|uniref:hypothetical protein n=1 Tax=Paraclostridium sordellii TaxID=1505 RepID=UPI0005E6EE86|nr:hypothetical protein [Paeniclostridium sordellii]CEN94267.1 Uncharacterised protein [[Clostridium] sordellii] [Paeniclostridium sordellii]CEN94709.1 Uncharacterised protein [[Clostridium] sordellii] [Paeniclostridium sordellii]